MSRSRESSLGSVAMEEEEDDLYGTAPASNAHNGDGHAPEDLEEGEEEEDDDDDDDESDIEIVTERPDLGPEPTTASRTGQKSSNAATISDPSQQTQSSASTSLPSQHHQLPARAAPTTIRITADPAAPQAQGKPLLLPGDKYPAIRTSPAIDFDNIPLWDGKPITELDIDADLAEQMKPWRRPGADQADYFNYGFDEFSWAMYCEKQKMMRGGIEEQRNENKMFEQMMGMPGMPGPGGAGGAGSNSPMPAAAVAAGGAGGMPGMPSEQDMMQMTMQYMQANGITDIGQVDFGAVMQQFGGMGAAGGGGVPTGPSGGGQQGGWGGQQGGYGGGGGGRRGRGRW